MRREIVITDRGGFLGTNLRKRQIERFGLGRACHGFRFRRPSDDGADVRKAVIVTRAIFDSQDIPTTFPRCRKESRAWQSIRRGPNRPLRRLYLVNGDGNRIAFAKFEVHAMGFLVEASCRNISSNPLNLRLGRGAGDPDGKLARFRHFDEFPGFRVRPCQKDRRHACVGRRSQPRIDDRRTCGLEHCELRHECPRHPIRCILARSGHPRNEQDAKGDAQGAAVEANEPRMWQADPQPLDLGVQPPAMQTPERLAFVVLKTFRQSVRERLQRSVRQPVDALQASQRGQLSGWAERPTSAP